MTDYATLDEALDDLETVQYDDADYAASHGIEFAGLTDPQREWRSLTTRYALWRGGNSIGKSYGQGSDIVDCARGTNRYRTVKPPPVDLMVIGYSFVQMDPLCKKIWDLLPKDEIDPRVRYEVNNGFRGQKEPCIPFIRGPGAGSVIRFATYEAGAERIMGWQGDGAYLDEPPPSTVYGEIIPRLNSKKGFLRISFTPTPESPDLEYLRTEIEAGRLVEMQTSLTTDAITIRNSPFDLLAPKPWMSQEEIDEALDRYLEEEREMREHGAWYPLAKGRWVNTFTQDNIDCWTPPPADAWVVVSIDHGANAGKQAAVVAAYTRRTELDARCWFWAESVSDGTTSSREDAQAILDMLASVGLKYEHVDQWIGDRPTGDNRFLISKSNQKLQREMAQILGMRVDQMKKIIVPFKYTGSVRHGSALMKTAFKRRDPRTGLPMAVVCPTMKRFADSLLKFKGDPRDPCKDVYDAGRYNIEAATRGAAWSPVRAVL